jgi:hypothetical protein
VFFDPSGDKIRLIPFVFRTVEFYGFAPGISRPEGFFLAVCIVGYDPIGGFQNRGGGPIILFQFDFPALGKILFKAEEVFIIGPPPGLDRVIVVPHHTHS